MVEKVSKASLSARELAERLDEYLRVDVIPDYPGAWNGLQVDRTGPIRKVALAVDAAEATIEAAVHGGADLLIVHHGLFWDGNPRVTERRYRRLHALIASNVGVYSSHLPLDAHEKVGNNSVLARKLGIEVDGAFGEYRGAKIGVQGRLSIRREALAARLDELLGARVQMITGGAERLERIAVVTGGGGSFVGEAQREGMDALITGEAAHHNYFDAMEGNLNLYLGGHYATEVWGVQALGPYLAETFGIESFFIDHPTGL